MTITLTPAVGSPVVLGDDAAGDYISGDLPQQNRAIQEDELFRAEEKVFEDRGNVENLVTFQTERRHVSQDEAMAFKYGHADEVPIKGDVEFEHAGFVSRFLQAAVISQVACVYHSGVTTRFSYTVHGGKFRASV
jgi:hypothetical protein